MSFPKYEAYKDSGVEWLGAVPEHWDVMRLKYLTHEITVGIVVEPSKYYVDEGIPALRSLNVKPGKILAENLVYISEESNELQSKSKIYAGDIVAVRSGQPGTAAVIPEELDGCNCIDLIIIRKPMNGSAEFLLWYLNGDAALEQFSEGTAGAIQQHFNISSAANLVISWPSEEEQHGITTYLKSACHKLDILIAEAETSKELLSERRSALISAAVTGKIDVRGWQAPASAAPALEVAHG
jgi:type I restriction enzyme, S subunit